MRKPRWKSMDLSTSNFYHIYSRCVRQLFLFGKDPVTGKDCSHRRTWVKERVEHLAAHFAIDIFFFGFLSNHFHIVLRNLPDQVDAWTDEEVIRRSCKIFPYKFKRLGVVDGEPTEERLAELVRDAKLVATLRKRLADPSWFVRQLNQKIATYANLEDDTKGHFFEGRFGSELIPNLFVLVICGLYVDLNEYAAGLAKDVATSLFSSVSFRLRGRERRRKGGPINRIEDGFLYPAFAPGRSGGDARGDPAEENGPSRTTPIFEFTLDQYVDCLEVLMDRLKGARKDLADGQRLPIDKELVAEMLREHDAFVAIASDFGE